MKNIINSVSVLMLSVFFLSVSLSGLSSVTVAAGHKDSLSDSLSPASDTSDVYFFRSWENPDKVILIMNVYPDQSPAGGPVFSVFDKDVVYRINIDNNMDGNANDIIYEFRFKNHITDTAELSGFPFPYIGNPQLPFPSLQGITSLNGPGSEGLRLKQYYSVKEIRRGKHKRLFRHQDLIAVPPNVGTMVMPDYEALAAQGIYTDDRMGIRVFVGQRAEATYADLGGLFNGLSFGRTPPFMTAEEDLDDTSNPYGNNKFTRSNVSTIALEIPINRLTVDEQPSNSTLIPLLGTYISTHRVKQGHHKRNKFNNFKNRHDEEENERLIQISRMANPTLNILITDFELKDRYNKTNPKDDAQYQDLVKYPPFATYLSYIVGLPVPPGPRLGNLSILYKYPGQSLDGENCGNPCADLLHLNLQVPPTPPEQQSRLGALLSPDPAGLPNGRRPHDDVYDITLRAFGGPAYFAARIGDGINFNEGVPGAGDEDGPGYGDIQGNKLDVTANGIVKEFPFLATPYTVR